MAQPFAISITHIGIAESILWNPLETRVEARELVVLFSGLPLSKANRSIAIPTYPNDAEELGTFKKKWECIEMHWEKTHLNIQAWKHNFPFLGG